MSYIAILKNSSWLVFGKCASLIVAFITLAVVARTYGANSFGELNLSLSIVALLIPVIQLGLNAIVTRDLVNHPNRQGEILGTVLFMRTAGTLSSILLVIILISIDWFSQPEIGQYVLVLLTGELLKTGFTFSFWFESKTKGKIITICELSATVVASLIRLILCFMQVDFSYILISHAIEGALIGIVFFLAYRSYSDKKIKLSFSQKLAVSYLKKCAPLIASSATAVIYQKIDQVMIAHYMDNAAVGIYAVASRISEVWYFVPTMIAVSAFPAILKARQRSEEAYDIYLQKIFDYLALLGYLAALSITLVAPFAIPLVFGDEYLASIPILVIHVWGGIFISVRALASKWILAEDILMYSLISQGAGAVLNVILNIIFIPKFGLVGAAYSTLFSYAAAGYLIFWIMPHSRKLSIMMTKSLLLHAFVDIYRLKKGKP